MNIIYCHCLGPHEPECMLALRLRIKAHICRERGYIGYVPESVEVEIDQELLRVKPS